jgi:hypothetical protein
MLPPDTLPNPGMPGLVIRRLADGPTHFLEVQVISESETGEVRHVLLCQLRHTSLLEAWVLLPSLLAFREARSAAPRYAGTLDPGN